MPFQATCVCLVKTLCALACFHETCDGFCDVATDLLMPMEAATAASPFHGLPLERQRSLGLLSETLPSDTCWRPFKPACGVMLGSGRPLTHFYELGDLKETVEPHFHTSVISATDSLSPLCVYVSLPLSL